MSLHQGGIVDTVKGEWWGWSMMDYNSLGRLTALSPITWHEGWPYFGLPGNLGRTPRTWFKPNVDKPSAPQAWLERSDGFDGPDLKPIWQWNHLPHDKKWSLEARTGFLRLETIRAQDFFSARNVLTQRAVGPVSVARVRIDAAGLKLGAVAGLGLLGLPYRWIGVRRREESWEFELYDQQTGQTQVQSIDQPDVVLQVTCDFLAETARFAISGDGESVEPLGDTMAMAFQLKTFQGIRYALFSYSETGEGGFADFDDFTVEEPLPRGLMRPIPDGQNVELRRYRAHNVVEEHPVWQGTVESLGQGQVALRSELGQLRFGDTDQIGYSTKPASLAETFMWMETPYGELMLMSRATNRFVRFGRDGSIKADAPGPDAFTSGVRLDWRIV